MTTTVLVIARLACSPLRMPRLSVPLETLDVILAHRSIRTPLSRAPTPARGHDGRTHLALHRDTWPPRSGLTCTSLRRLLPWLASQVVHVRLRARAPRWSPVTSRASEDTWASTLAALPSCEGSASFARAPFALGTPPGLSPLPSTENRCGSGFVASPRSPSHSTHHRFFRSTRLNALSRSPCLASALPTFTPCLHTQRSARLQGLLPPTSP